MTHISAEKKVYCYTLEGSRYLFADERVKMHLIDLINEIHRRNGWLLFAFCILDNSAYFIIGADKIAAVVRAIQTTVRKNLWQPPEFRSVRENRMELNGQVEKLETMAEIVFRSREIHRLPLEQGYVNALEDYWWSSYPTYTGLHIWEMVDRSVLSMAFSPDPYVARRQLERFYNADTVRTYEMNEILIYK
ncbi:MAG: hypothetical protein LIP12_03860 [Clostridiales bacterium]|nr:hypothetical protein [Clostridiales bacterium]